MPDVIGAYPTGPGGVPAGYRDILPGERFTLQLFFRQIGDLISRAPEPGAITATEFAGYGIGTPVYQAGPDGTTVLVPLEVQQKQNVAKATEVLRDVTDQLGADAAAVVAAPGQALSAAAAAVGDGLRSAAKAAIGPAIAVGGVVLLAIYLYLRR